MQILSDAHLLRIAVESYQLLLWCGLGHTALE